MGLSRTSSRAFRASSSCSRSRATRVLPTRAGHPAPRPRLLRAIAAEGKRNRRYWRSERPEIQRSPFRALLPKLIVQVCRGLTVDFGARETEGLRCHPAAPGHVSSRQSRCLQKSTLCRLRSMLLSRERTYISCWGAVSKDHDRGPATRLSGAHRQPARDGKPWRAGPVHGHLAVMEKS